MSALDNLLPGNRHVVVNGVAASPGRDTLEVVMPGASVSDDPTHLKTVVTIPPQALPNGSYVGELLRWNGSAWEAASNRIAVGWDNITQTAVFETGVESDGGIPLVGFFHAGLVRQQAVVGATTTDQLNSLINALAAMGLIIDDR